MNLTEKKLIDKVDSWFSKNSFKKSKNITVAFSGGADSLALLAILKSSSFRFNLTACYVNHNLRSKDELSKEIKLNYSNCESLNVKLDTIEINQNDIDNLIKNDNRSPEEAARIVRYNVLTEYCKNRKSYLATAHHKDDQDETILMRFIEGSGISGLSGIPEINGIIIRPLLNINKTDLLAYINKMNLRWSIDSTNCSEKFKRNRIRSKIIPILESEFPGFKESLSKIKIKMDSAANYIESAIDINKLQSYRDGSIRFPLSFFQQLLPEIRVNYFFKAINKIKSDNVRVPFRFYSFLYEKKLPSKWQLNGYGIDFFCYNDIIYLINSEAPVFKFTLIDEGLLKNNNKLKIEDNSNDIAIKIDSSLDLGICYRKSNLKIKLSNGKHQKLKKRFSSMRIPHFYRNRIPLIYNEDFVVAIWGAFYDFNNYYSVKITNPSYLTFQKDIQK